MPLANILAPLTGAEEWVLEGLHSIGLGWGLAIVGLVVLVRLATLPLVVRQFRSQRELREHMPEMRRLQQRHKNDKQRLQQEMQAYYREHGINPLASFAPLLVQIPIFISLYYLMRQDVKSGLFGDVGFLFIPHLTDKPTGAVLVALITAYLASQLAGSLIATRAMKGGQKRLMLALPLLFVGIVARFPPAWRCTGSPPACGPSASRSSCGACSPAAAASSLGTMSRSLNDPWTLAGHTLPNRLRAGPPGRDRQLVRAPPVAGATAPASWSRRRRCRITATA